MAEIRIVDEQEVLGWIRAGRTDQWMTQEYERRYNLCPAPQLFGRFRARVAHPSSRTSALVPWEVRPEHRWDYAFAMLRVESRRRSGATILPVDLQRLRDWKSGLAARGVVVHYDPQTQLGWCYVPRRPGTDRDLIREPCPQEGPTG